MSDQNRKFRDGIDLGGTKIEIAALGADARVVGGARGAAPQGAYKGTIAAIKALIEGLEARLGPVDRVGIAIPGAVSPATGLIKNANSTCLIGKPFEQDLSKA